LEDLEDNEDNFQIMGEQAMPEYAVVGKPIPRVEAAEKVTGRALFAADVKLPGMLYAKLVRSPYGHARIRRIDVSRAKEWPGVVAVLTGEDLPEQEEEPASRSRALLARGRVIFQGQPVAAVIATTPQACDDARGLVEVEYEVLPAVVDPEAAAHADAPPVRRVRAEEDRAEAAAHDATFAGGGSGPEQAPNITNRVGFKRGDIEQGFREADRIFEQTYRIGRAHQAYIEPHAATAAFDASGNLTIWTSTQGQFSVREEVARLLGLPETRIKVIPTEIGGGFGGKNRLVAPLTALLARKVGRPVQLVMSRSEELTGANPAAAAVFHVKTGVKNDGTLTALQVRAIFDAGSFPGSPLSGGCMLMASYYRFPHLDVEGIEVVTHKASVAAYRAPGAPQGAFAIEQQMDLMARELGIDPIEFRLKNASRPGDLMANGQRWPNHGLIQVLERLRAHPLWQERGKQPGRGVGVAIGGWFGGMQPAAANVRLNADGTCTVVVGAVDLTGTNTALAQIAAEVLNSPMEQVSIVTAPSDVAPQAGVSAGSKIIYTVGNAVLKAAEDARRQMLEIAANELECDVDDLEFLPDRIQVRGTDRSISRRQIGRMAYTPNTKYPPVIGHGRVGLLGPSPGFAGALVGVEVDQETGRVRVTDVVIAQDVGFAINPMAVEGQMQGGIVQSIGWGLFEELIYDEQGRLLNPSFLDYRLMTALDLPKIETILVEVPSEEGPFGARKVGEPSIVPGMAAVANALADATGVRFTHAPITPERVVQGLRAHLQGART
jgi:CO/xanthine dehydrogenase Mo-binding subunit